MGIRQTFGSNFGRTGSSRSVRRTCQPVRQPSCTPTNSTGTRTAGGQFSTSSVNRVAPAKTTTPTAASGSSASTPASQPAAPSSSPAAVKNIQSSSGNNQAVAAKPSAHTEIKDYAALDKFYKNDFNNLPREARDEIRGHYNNHKNNQTAYLDSVNATLKKQYESKNTAALPSKAPELQTPGQALEKPVTQAGKNNIQPAVAETKPVTDREKSAVEPASFSAKAAMPKGSESTKTSTQFSSMQDWQKFSNSPEFKQLPEKVQKDLSKAQDATNTPPPPTPESANHPYYKRGQAYKDEQFLGSANKILGQHKQDSQQLAAHNTTRDKYEHNVQKSFADFMNHPQQGLLTASAEKTLGFKDAEKYNTPLMQDVNKRIAQALPEHIAKHQDDMMLANAASKVLYGKDGLHSKFEADYKKQNPPPDFNTSTPQERDAYNKKLFAASNANSSAFLSDFAKNEENRKKVLTPENKEAFTKRIHNMHFGDLLQHYEKSGNMKGLIEGSFTDALKNAPMPVQASLLAGSRENNELATTVKGMSSLWGTPEDQIWKQIDAGRSEAMNPLKLVKLPGWLSAK